MKGDNPKGISQGVLPERKIETTARKLAISLVPGPVKNICYGDRPSACKRGPSSQGFPSPAKYRRRQPGGKIFLYRGSGLWYDAGDEFPHLVQARS